MNILASSASGLRWLVLDLNSFFASCEQQENPGLRGLPIAIAPMLSDSTCAIAASYPAKACGIKTGTPIYEAKRLCPGLRVVVARHKLYVAYHHRILAAINDCIPIADTLSIDEVSCRLDRNEEDPVAASALAKRIKQSIRDQVGICMTSSIGIASNILLAKLASDMQKPDGLTLLPSASLPQSIAHLPAQAICGVGRNMARRLAAQGIQTIGDLWQRDSHQLRQIWGGIHGVRFHALLHGADLPRIEHPRRSISHQHVLPPWERSLAAATPVLRQLLARAAERLRHEDYYCRRLSVGIKWLHHTGHWRQDLACQETQDTALLLRGLTQLLTSAPALAPLRVGVVLSDLVPTTQHQGDLFAARPPPARRFGKPPPPALAHAIDAINGAYGRGMLHYGLEERSLRQMGSKIAFQRVPDLNEF
ncbi:MAG: hypothetical protein KBA75_10195 [Alphaproteobacteria bacterium]|nr:hypothetical protein [Alphaproteobacteria bacterium]